MRDEGQERTRPRAAQEGFTLLEILVALAVVAVALGALVSQAGRSMENTARLRDHTLAHWVAMNVVTEQRLAGKWPGVGVHDGHNLMADREWYWTLTVSATADRNVRRMDVVVYGDRRREKRMDALIAYIGRPLR